MGGTLAGIARHAEPKGPMETLDHVAVTTAEGLRGDYRGARASLKPDRKRQVTLIEEDCVSAAIAEAGIASKGGGAQTAKSSNAKAVKAAGAAAAAAIGQRLLNEFGEALKKKDQA